MFHGIQEIYKDDKEAAEEESEGKEEKEEILRCLN